MQKKPVFTPMDGHSGNSGDWHVIRFHPYNYLPIVGVRQVPVTYQVSYSRLVALPLTSPAAGFVSSAPEVRNNRDLSIFYARIESGPWMLRFMNRIDRRFDVGKTWRR